MGFCFLCNAKLHRQTTQVCSSLTPHSNVPCVEKIAELVGDECVIIVTPADHMCKNCSTLLTHMDKLQNDIKLVKNGLLTFIKKKYKVIPPGYPVPKLEVVDGDLKTTELEVGQRKVPSGLRLKDKSNNLSKTLDEDDANASYFTLYRCRFCPFKHYDIRQVRIHMDEHAHNISAEKAAKTLPQTATKTLASMQQQQPPKKRKLFKCLKCSLTFDCQATCLNHITAIHGPQTSTTMNEPENAGASSSVSVKSYGNQKSTSAATDVNCQLRNKDAVYPVMLNDHVSINRITAVKQYGILKKNKNKVAEETMPVHQEKVDNFETAVGENLAIGGKDVETKAVDALESMLAAIHNDRP